MQKVVVGMSGGVDSAVAAYLLKKQGYDVIGLFMKNWDETDDDGACTAEEDYDDARAVSLSLGIPCYSVNFTKEYWTNVFIYFLDEYKKGRTPNPDVLCNKEIKFKCFLDYAMNIIDADYIATGHYARIEHTLDGIKLLKGVDKKKDQSYFLSLLKSEQLERVIFPLGEMKKSEVREIANREGFRNAQKKDSTGICFIGERNFTKFLNSYLPAQKGKMIDLDTKEVMGEHNGLMFYTIGQRRGLGIGGGGSGERWYVCDKDIENNILYIVQGANNPKLFVKGFIAKNVSMVSNKYPDNNWKCNLKYRYQQPLKNVTCEVIDDDKVKVIFEEPQSGVAPGQIGVFYDEEVCLGGGTIDELIK